MKQQLIKPLTKKQVKLIGSKQPDLKNVYLVYNFDGVALAIGKN